MLPNSAPRVSRAPRGVTGRLRGGFGGWRARWPFEVGADVYVAILVGVAVTCAVGLIVYRGLEWYADRWGL